MFVELTAQEDHVVLALTGELTVFNATSFKEEYFSKLEACGEKKIKVDLGGVEEFDSTALQTLIVGQRVLPGGQSQIDLVSLTDPIKKFMILTNATEHINIADI